MDEKGAPALSEHCGRLWPGGKARSAGKQKDLKFNSASALLFLQKLWSVDIVFVTTPKQQNIKMAFTAAQRNAESVWR